MHPTAARLSLSDIPWLIGARPTRSREETLRHYQLDPDKKTIVLLPGSRTQEVRYLLPSLLQATSILGDTYQFILAVAPTLDLTEIEATVSTHSASIHVVQRDTYNVIHASDLALVASGTATVETALLERPMVIVYRLAPVTYALARLFVRVPFIGMPNLIAGRQVVPELIQSAVTPERIAAEAQQLLTDTQAYSVAQEGLREVRTKLGEPGAAKRAADLILGLLAQR